MKGYPRVITIDGPAGSGKTTVARLLARRLGYGLLESGSLYRAFTWVLLKEAPDWLKNLDEKRIEAFLKTKLPEFRFFLETEGLKIFFRGKPLLEELRHPETEGKVSEVAALPAVRALVNEILRQLVQEKPAVAEGRDMGSVVFPDSPAKFFLTASPEIRARRRYLEWRAKGLEVSEEEVLAKIRARDEKDTSRQEAPLAIPEGAVVIDTSDLQPEKVLQLILQKLDQGRP